MVVCRSTFNTSSCESDWSCLSQTGNSVTKCTRVDYYSGAWVWLHSVDCNLGSRSSGAEWLTNVEDVGWLFFTIFLLWVALLHIVCIAYVLTVRSIVKVDVWSLRSVVEVDVWSLRIWKVSSVISLQNDSISCICSRSSLRQGRSLWRGGVLDDHTLRVRIRFCRSLRWAGCSAVGILLKMS